MSNVENGQPSLTTPRRRIAIEDIMQGMKEVVIEHRGEEYRLRITSNLKLILTK